MNPARVCNRLFTPASWSRLLALPCIIAAVSGSVLTACRAEDTASEPREPDVLVSVRTGALDAPDSARAGWRRVRVEEDGNGHIVVLFRLPLSASNADVASFLAALDTTPATPQPGVAIGGPEVGDRGDVIVHLTPGRYVVGCVRRGADEHRHASSGESAVLTVAEGVIDPARATAPDAAHVVRMGDFAFAGAEKWTAGARLLRIENSGQQDHQIRIVRLRAGSSMKAWMTADDPDTEGTAVAGIARVGPGEVAFLPVDLEAGAYVVYCLVTDPTTQRPHLELGMLRAIQVE